MTIEEFISVVRAGYRYKYIYHFTDRSNLTTMKHFEAVLSKQEQLKKGCPVEKPGGDRQSKMSDQLKGINDHVSLCLTSNHPMAYRCRQDGRHPDQVYIGFDPIILKTPRTLACLGLANANDTNIEPLEEVIPRMDLEALYGNLQWSVETQSRVDAVQRYEILVPTAVSLKYAKKLIEPR